MAGACAHSQSIATMSKKCTSCQNIFNIDSVNDNGLLVTSINQTQDLMRLKDTSKLFARLKASDEWIQFYSLENLQLSLEEMMKKACVVKDAGDAAERLEFSPEIVQEFESQLLMVHKLYDKRLQWLLRGSRKMFGVIKGSSLGVLIDMSDMNYGPRLFEYQTDLMALIDEQLRYMKKLYFISFGTEVSALWQTPQEMNESVLSKAKQWVRQLKPSGSCNLLKALQKTFPIQDLDSLAIIVGSCPDQAAGILSDYTQQCLVGRQMKVHTVAYDCSSQVPPAVLKKLAEEVGGHYHCYSGEDEKCYSSEINLVLDERRKADNLLGIVNDLYEGKMCDSLFNLMKESSRQSVRLSLTTQESKPPEQENLLALKIPGVLAKTSSEWLKTYGLKAKKLNLYQVLAPNSFSPVQEFVPVLQKIVSSTLHEKAMTQFEWHDGTIKNVHVDPPILYDYQKQLRQMVKLYEQRIDWLSVSSRRIWGAVCEKRVLILVDVSKTNSPYIVHIQHSLRLLLEEQMLSTDLFNILSFGSEVKAWQPKMLPPYRVNLQNAWRWFLSVSCEGTRNVMNVLKRALEVDFEGKERHESQSLYLLVTGVPDQETDLICSYLAEVCGGCDLQLNVCLFSLGAFSLEDDIPPRYASPGETADAYRKIVQATNGRFHWFGETGIYESSDISLILSEIEKAVSYSQKCAALVESLRQQRSGGMLVNQPVYKDDPPALKKEEKKSTPSTSPFPKPTALTLARKSLRIHPDGMRNDPHKPLQWRPTSSKAEIPPVQPIEEIFLARKKCNFRSNRWTRSSDSLYNPNQRKNIGTIYQKYLNSNGWKKMSPLMVLPNEKEICSSKTWLRKYSMKNLGLDLPSLAFGPGSRHQKQMVKSLHKKVSARYCDIFPSVEMQGIVKHLQMQAKDLEEYIGQVERVLPCYVQRVQWLLSGSRRYFGVVLEANVCILIDTSGSMEHSLDLVAKELTSLIWEQLRRNTTKFDLIAFAEDVEVWQECLVEATDEACHDAAQWLSRFQAHGNTSILKALRRAFSLQDVEALYILTDGKPDSSCNLVLKEIEMLRKKRAIKINTISFNCSDRIANDFLKKLASQTGGRYHQRRGDIDGQVAAHRLLTEGFKDEEDPVFPLFEGEDLKLLVEEIAKARNYLTQAKLFRSLLLKKDTNSKSCPS